MDTAIDLRSDTVTRPTPGMRQAMAAAEVGDDVFGEDPTVNHLQARAASLLGFEAALFVPSGTMGNAVGLRVLGEPGEEVLADDRSHVIQYELAGMAVLSGLIPRAIQTSDGRLSPEAIAGALKPKAYYRSDQAVVVLENTHNLAGGTVYSVEEMRAAIGAARAAGLKVHVDGARIWNAAVALGVAPRDLLAGADTAMVCLSKGLCAPVGSLLVGSRERIEKARRVRKQLGGGMRQAGILAAAGIVALESMIPRLAEDHDNARLLAEALARGRDVRVAPVRTNIVVAALRGRSAPEVVSALAKRGVLTTAMDSTTLRAVTHHDVSSEDCRRAAAILEQTLAA
jgi:threonine aldolase